MDQTNYLHVKTQGTVEWELRVHEYEHKLRNEVKTVKTRSQGWARVAEFEFAFEIGTKFACASLSSARAP